MGLTPPPGTIKTVLLENPCPGAALTQQLRTFFVVQAIRAYEKASDLARDRNT